MRLRVSTIFPKVDTIFTDAITRGGFTEFVFSPSAFGINSTRFTSFLRPELFVTRMGNLGLTEYMILS